MAVKRRLLLSSHLKEIIRKQAGGNDKKYGKGSSEEGQRAAEEIISANGRKPPIPRYCLP